MELNHGISNIRYGELGKIVFDYKGVEITIKEPDDVMLVDSPLPEASRWIWDKYKLMLKAIK